MGGRICRRSCWRKCWRRLGGRRAAKGYISSLRHGAAGVRWVESRVRYAGEAAMMRRETTDEAMGMLVLRFPAVASLEVNDTQRRC